MNKLLKVTFEYDNEIKYLKRKEAERWINSINSMCLMEHIHGRPFPKFNWKIKGKKCK